MHTQADTGRVKRRIEYYRRYLVASVDGVRLVGASSATTRDGDGAYYRNLAHAALVPTPEPT